MSSRSQMRRSLGLARTVSFGGLLGCALVALVLNVGCVRRHTLTGPEQFPVSGPAPSVRSALISALAQLGYEIVDMDQRTILARYSTPRRRWFRVRITPRHSRFDVDLINSSGLHERDDGRTHTIARRYLGHLRRLRKVVDRELESGRHAGARSSLVVTHPDRPPPFQADTDEPLRYPVERLDRSGARTLAVPSNITLAELNRILGGMGHEAWRDDSTPLVLRTAPRPLDAQGDYVGSVLGELQAGYVISLRGRVVHIAQRTESCIEHQGARRCEESRLHRRRAAVDDLDALVRQLRTQIDLSRPIPQAPPPPGLESPPPEPIAPAPAPAPAPSPPPSNSPSGLGDIPPPPR